MPCSFAGGSPGGSKCSGSRKIVKKCLLIKQKTIDITGFFGISWYNWYKGFEGANGNAAKPLHLAPGVSLKNEFISSRH